MWYLLLALILLPIVLAGLCFAAALYQASSRPRVVCLMYHRLAPREIYEKRQGTERVFTLPAESFEEQIRYLKNAGYSFLTCEQVRDWAAGEFTPPDPSVLLTFDDGCISVYEVALPILERHDARVVCFFTLDPESYVFTELAGGERRLSDDELKTADGPTIEFESHAVSHQPLRGMTDDEIRFELVESKCQLEQILSRDIRFLAIPGNWFDANVMKIARQVGYQAVWCSRPGFTRAGMSVYGLPRINVEGQLTMPQFVSAISPRGVAIRRFLAWIKSAPARWLGPKYWLPVRKIIMRCIPGHHLSMRRVIVISGVVLLVMIFLVGYILSAL